MPGPFFHHHFFLSSVFFFFNHHASSFTFFTEELMGKVGAADQRFPIRLFFLSCRFSFCWTCFFLHTHDLQWCSHETVDLAGERRGAYFNVMTTAVFLPGQFICGNQSVGQSISSPNDRLVFCRRVMVQTVPKCNCCSRRR